MGSPETLASAGTAAQRIGRDRYVFFVKSLISTAKALVDPTRVRILRALREGELCVCELCDGLGVTQSTLSTHLQVLRGSGLLITRRAGKWNYYRIARKAERLVDFLLAFFAVSLGADRRLQADGRRLKKRLALREAGACCVGFPCARLSPGKARK